MSGLIAAPQLIGQPQPALYLPFALHKTLDGRITYTGGANRTYFDSTPDLQDGTTNVARFDHLLSDGTSLGLSVWEARTDGIRNNTMTGASAGTPGTLPNNWEVVLQGTTQEIVAVATINGIEYIDIRLSGTPSSDIRVHFDTTTGVAALTGDTRTTSAYMAIVGGNFSNISGVMLRQQEKNGAGATVKTNTGSDFKSSLTSSLQRFSYTVTLSGGGTVEFVRPQLHFNWDGSGAIDLTLRIGLPQEEEGTGGSPVIKTTNAAVTATASLVSIPPKAIKTVLIAARTGASGGTQVLWQRDDGDENDRIRIERNSSDEIRLFVTDGGVEQITDGLDLGTVADNTDFKVAVRFDTNDFAGSLDGAAVVADTGGTIPAITADFFGVDSVGNYWNSTIALFAGWANGLSDNMLRALAA